MIAKQMLPAVCAGLLCLINLAGCAPATTSAPAAQASATTAVPPVTVAAPAATALTVATISSEAATAAPAPAATAASAVESNQAEAGGTQTVTSTVDLGPVEEGEPMQTEPGAGSEAGPAGVAPDASGLSTSPGDLLTFADPAYGFEVSHPADFIVSSVPGGALAQLAPAPVVGYRFMNPQTAASDIVELEPADLEIRIHTLPAGTGIEPWLVANGLLPADGSVTPAPFAAANVQGIEVCASTMIAPGCSYYFAGGGYIYQLIPATLEGEAMMRSFRVAG